MNYEYGYPDEDEDEDDKGFAISQTTPSDFLRLSPEDQKDVLSAINFYDDTDTFVAVRKFLKKIKDMNIRLDTKVQHYIISSSPELVNYLYKPARSVVVAACMKLQSHLSVFFYDNMELLEDHQLITQLLTQALHEEPTIVIKLFNSFPMVVDKIYVYRALEKNPNLLIHINRPSSDLINFVFSNPKTIMNKYSCDYICDIVIDNIDNPRVRQKWKKYINAVRKYYTLYPNELEADLNEWHTRHFSRKDSI